MIGQWSILHPKLPSVYDLPYFRQDESLKAVTLPNYPCVQDGLGPDPGPKRDPGPGLGP